MDGQNQRYIMSVTTRKHLTAGSMVALNYFTPTPTSRRKIISFQPLNHRF